MLLAFIPAAKPVCVAVRLCFFDGAMALRDVCLSLLSIREGRFCVWQQARALALREASAETHGAPWLRWIAERVRKVDVFHPSRVALSQLFASVDADPDWHPGKHCGTKRGPKPLLTAAKRPFEAS